MTDSLEALLGEPSPQASDPTRTLRSPGVGLFTCALPRGHAIVPGQRIGVLTTLGRAVVLVAPATAAGRIVSESFERVRQPVGWGDVLYRLEPLTADALAAVAAQAPAEEDGGPAVRATQSGRFWRRPSPKDPPLAAEGDLLERGTPLGMIEVMKTFTHVVYVPGNGLPERARVVRFAIGEGDEVALGDRLAVVEEA